MNYIGRAEQLEAIAADLRAEAARDTGTGQLPLTAAPFLAWTGGDEPPVRGNVDYRLRAMPPGGYNTGPADVLDWRHNPHAPGADVIEYRASAEQPDT